MHISSIIAGLTACVATVAASSLSAPVISTHYGTIHGGVSPFRGGDKAYVYKGIPYAQPPTGANRWTHVGGPSYWGSLNATEFGPQCAQTISSAGIFSSGKNTTSEDCLYLNIWTPAYAKGTNLTSLNLPVLFWIYGGRFTGGSGDVVTYDGTGLATKDIIVVTINYRLGPFGFLAHPELSAESGHNSSGNYGILDQQAALHWVNENIQKFGGNPNQITVGGQSAGSASSLDVMWSPLAKGLAEGIISESGARGTHDPMTGSDATSYRTKESAEAQGVDFLKTMNVSSISELRNVSMEALLAYDSLADTIFEGTVFNNLSQLFMEPPLWRPNIDGYVLPYSYSGALRNNTHADIPILTGNNKDEGASPSLSYNSSEYHEVYSDLFGNLASEFFELYPGRNSSEASESANEFYRDLSRVGTWGWSVEWAAGGAKSNVYTYYFDHAPAENREAGAYHGAELWYTFNNIPYSDYSNVTWTKKDLAVEEMMSNYWANFIRTGNPNGNSQPKWNPSVKGSHQTMWLGNSWVMGPISLNERRIKFLHKWTSTLPAW